MNIFFCWIYWDPSKTIFKVPFVDHFVTWYGLLFALGVFFSYLLAKNFLFKNFEKRDYLTDKLLIFIVIGIVLGARLGHVFFYDWPIYKDAPLEIFKVWKGGLSSHGGALGVFLSLFIFRFCIRKDFPSLTFLKLVDILTIPAALVASFIRVGNFINQEICGKVTDLPWAIIFAFPAENVVGGVPRHPVQLYEALFYLFVFVCLFLMWYLRGKKMHVGTISGFFFITIFSFRFFVEFLKLTQSVFINEGSFLSMGQILSVPFIILGIVLLLRRRIYAR